MANLDGEKGEYYNKGYYQGYRKATIDHLGSKCSQCDEKNPYQLEIHHRNDLHSKARDLSDLQKLEELELRCFKHHNNSWRKENGAEEGTEEHN